MNKTIDDLKREQDEEFEWQTNPIKRAILLLFRDELTDTKYRKHSVAEIHDIASSAFQNGGALAGRHHTTAQRLLRKVQKAASPDQAVLALGDYLLAE